MSEHPVTTPPSSAKGDDRNLVPVEASPAVSLEDQVYLFWKKNRNLVLGVVIVALAAILGWKVYEAMQAGREAEIRAAFGQAGTVEAKRTFARAHAGHPLAGLALLLVADDSLTNQRFDEAAREYAAAAKELKEPLLLGRARIGEGVAAIKAGQSAQGETTLLAITTDTSVMMAFRGQAFYELAQAAATAGNNTKAIEYIDRLKALDPEGQWANIASGLRARLGGLDGTAMP